MMPGLKGIYTKLYGAFGPQHWWPADSAFEVMVGAVLTQNTSWRNVEKAIANLKKEKVLSARPLLRLPQARLARLLRPAGYFNIKALRLKSLVTFFVEHYGGSASRMARKPCRILRRQLLELNGIGPETADSILLYALGKPVFVVDAYTRRILSRHGLAGADAGYDQIQGLFTGRLKKNGRLFNEYHALLVKLGKDFCLKNKPKCGLCPLRHDQ